MDKMVNEMCAFTYGRDQEVQIPACWDQVYLQSHICK